MDFNNKKLKTFKKYGKMHLNKKKIDDFQKIWQQSCENNRSFNNKRNDKTALAYTVQKPPHKYYSVLKYKQEKFIFGSLKNIRKT